MIFWNDKAGAVLWAIMVAVSALGIFLTLIGAGLPWSSVIGLTMLGTVAASVLLAKRR